MDFWDVDDIFECDDDDGFEKCAFWDCAAWFPIEEGSVCPYCGRRQPTRHYQDQDENDVDALED